MVALASLVFILFLSLMVVRVAAVALTLTGMTREAARFQARSAWTGTGFTTAELEQVVNHPVRREIISFLILLRNAGFVTAASALVLSFVSVEHTGQGWLRIAVLVAALVALWLAARSSWLDKNMSQLIAWALKRYSDLDTRDYATLLHLAGEYGIKELKVDVSDWLAGKTLKSLALPNEGILVLGIIRPDGTYLGAPRGDTTVEAGDRMLVYGRSPTLADIDRRRADASGEEDRRKSIDRRGRIEAEDIATSSPTT